MIQLDNQQWTNRGLVARAALGKMHDSLPTHIGESRTVDMPQLLHNTAEDEYEPEVSAMLPCV